MARAKAQRPSMDREPGWHRASLITEIGCLKHTLYSGTTGLSRKDNSRRGTV